jgi:hypothetical protein
MTKRVVTISAALAAVLIAVPPWYQGCGLLSRKLGFGWLWSPPGNSYGNCMARIDVTQLVVEIVGAIAVSIVLAQIPWRKQINLR